MIKALLFDLDGTLYDRDVVRLARDGRHGHGEKEAGYEDIVRGWGLDAALARAFASDVS
jgi:FMN phosphatase YigB (HAD superfamily)